MKVRFFCNWAGEHHPFGEERYREASFCTPKARLLSLIPRFASITPLVKNKRYREASFCTSKARLLSLMPRVASSWQKLLQKQNGDILRRGGGAASPGDLFLHE